MRRSKQVSVSVLVLAVGVSKPPVCHQCSVVAHTTRYILTLGSFSSKPLQPVQCVRPHHLLLPRDIYCLHQQMIEHFYSHHLLTPITTQQHHCHMVSTNTKAQNDCTLKTTDIVSIVVTNILR